MKKFINVITLGIPYIVNLVRVGLAVKKQFDLNNDGKVSTSELAKIAKHGTVAIEVKEKK